jgi:hypothetical protein
MQMIEKDVYKKLNPTIGSPDVADAISLTFYEKHEVPYEILWI